MKHYHKILLEMGWKRDWNTKPISQYSNKTLYMIVEEQEDGYHKFAVCPKKCFDRWSNSRHINFSIMVKNYTKTKGCGWTQVMVDVDFEKKVRDAIWLCKTIKARMFNQFITINL